MKFIDLEVLCQKTETSHPESYSNVLKDLNIDLDETEYYWTKLSLNYDPLKEEMLGIETRKDNENHSVITFYGGDTSIIVNMTVDELKEKLKNVT
jgi:hypothetical protein